MINVEWRGADDRGVTSTRLPILEFYDVTTDKPTLVTEVGKLELYIRPGYFRSRDMDTTNWNEEQKTSLEVYNGVYLRISDIGTTQWGGYDFRMQAQYSTHNEIKQVAHLNLGFDDLLVENQSKWMPGMWFNTQTVLTHPNLNYFWDLSCTVSRTKEATIYYTAVMNMYNITVTDYANFDFRLGFAGFRNYKDTNMQTPLLGSKNTNRRNTYAHMTLQSQRMLRDGSWWDTHRVTDWRHIGQIYVPVPAEATISNANTDINDITFGIIHPTQNLRIAPHRNYAGRTYIVLELEDPWEHLYRRRYHGSRYCRLNGNNVPCHFYMQPFRWQLSRLNGGVNTGNQILSTFGMLTAPSFAIQKPYKVYYHNNHVVD